MDHLVVSATAPRSPAPGLARRCDGTPPAAGERKIWALTAAERSSDMYRDVIKEAV